MLGVANRKNKVSLADYQYKKDIANRLFLSDLTPADVHILQELLYLPSKIELSELIENVTVSNNELTIALDKFSSIGLTSLQKNTLFIDKELRKYFEFHLSKFSLEPSFDFLQGLLARVPISVLPNWYSIPRTSDNIFSSLVEKHLQTPKIYEQYLNELTFTDPVLKSIIHDVFASPNLVVKAADLRKRYEISKEKFQEHMLTLEFHFVLVSSFRDWQEVVTPFYEWAEYLRFLKEKAPRALPANKVTSGEDVEFAYLKSNHKSSMNFQEQALLLFRKTIDEWQICFGDVISSVERSVYDVERALRHIPEGQWILFDDFLASMIVPIGQMPPVHLARVGKKWRYALPQYSEKERAFIEKVVCVLLYQVGITMIGSFDGRTAFKITSFGRIALGEH